MQTANQRQIAIIAAVEFEIHPRLRQLDLPGTSLTFHTFGIGALASAANAKPLAKELTGKDVIYIGTCGSFGAFAGVELVTASEVRWSCFGERIGKAYRIKNTMEPVSIPVKASWAPSLKTKTCLCAASISLDPSLDAEEPAANFIENVELYSVASYISGSVASLTPVLAVTNTIGPEAHAEWLKNHKAAAALTADVVTKLLMGT